MKNAIFVVDTNGMLSPNSLASMGTASARWGCGFVRITRNVDERLHPACWKALAFELASEALRAPVERLLILDADTVVSSKCPDPFYSAPHLLQVVTDRQTQCPARDKAEQDEWKIVAPGLPLPSRFFNSGVMLASAEHHWPLFRRVYSLCLDFPHLCWHDQTPFNVVFRDYEHLSFATDAWNYLNPAGRIANWQDMAASEKFIYHFAGNPDRKQQIDQVMWQRH